MGSWNVRRVRLQKQLNYFAKQMGGGETGKKSVAAAIVRHRKAYGPKSKAMAFWRGGYVYRDGKFYATGSTKGRKVQYPTGRKGAGRAGILRQNVGLTRGMKTSKGAGKKANERQVLFTIPGASAKAIKKTIAKGVPLNTTSFQKTLNSYIRSNPAFKALEKRDAGSRKRSDATSFGIHKAKVKKNKQNKAKAVVARTKTGR